MKYLLPAVAAVLALVGLSGPSNARMKPRPMSQEQYLQRAASGNQFVMESSQLALRKSNNEDIKKFAQRMIHDHTKIGNGLKATLQKANLPEPKAGLDRADETLLMKLRNEKGPAFERNYVRDLRQVHIQALRLTEGYARAGTNPALKKFAVRTLPMVREHLKLAEALPGGRNLTARR